MKKMIGFVVGAVFTFLAASPALPQETEEPVVQKAEKAATEKTEKALTTESGKESEAKKTAKNFYVTDVGSEDIDGKKIYYIVINDIIKISEIEVSKIAGKTIIKWPTYVSSRSGRNYAQVKIKSKAANDLITETITSGKAQKPKVVSDSMDFEITTFNPSRSKSRKVNAEVTFADALTISCGIMETGGDPWIAWPSRRDEQSGQWVQQIYFRGAFKKTVDDALLNKYKVFKTEGDAEWR